jgi:DNA polymerase-4
VGSRLGKKLHNVLYLFSRACFNAAMTDSDSDALSRFAPIPGEVSWLYVDFDSYFASCEQLLRPELRGKPVAVVPVVAETTCAIAASYEAKAFGVKTGTRIWEAKKRCPGLILVPARHEAYVLLHEQAKEAIERCHPVAAVCSIDEIACRLRGCDRAPLAARKLALEIKQKLASSIGEALHCSIGIASNMFLAKIAADFDKPNGLSILLPEDMPGRLLELHLTDLTGVAKAMETRLHEAGIKSLPDLWALSPRAFRRIWGGVGGERFWYKLHGYDLPLAGTQRSTIGHSRVLEPRLREAELAHYVARRLLLKAVSRMRRMRYCAGALELGVRFMDRSSWRGHHRFKASDDSFLFLNALASLWRQMLTKADAKAILKVGVSLSELVEVEQATGDLFAWNAKARPNADLSAAMDRVHRRFGRHALTVGFEPAQLADLGTKIAFTRVPDASEFGE